MAGVLVSIAVASFVAAQAAGAGGAMRLVLPLAAGMSAVLSAFWTLAIETLFPHPDFWANLLETVAVNAVLAAIGAAAFTFATGNLITKISAFKKKYPDR
ncbi:MAG: hypothetical protein AAF160_03205 [Pseudomonadota bacterium]